jgi:hypothetical protein
MEPKKSNNSITILNFSQKDLSNAQKDLRLLKEKMTTRFEFYDNNNLNILRAQTVKIESKRPVREE